MNRFVSFSTKNMFLHSVLILVIVLGSGAVLYSNFFRIFYKQITADMDQIMIRNVSNLDQIIDSINQATLLLYTDKTIIDTITKSEPNDQFDTYKKRELISDQLANNIYIPLHNKLTFYQITFFVPGNFPLTRFLSASDTSLNGVYSDKMVANEPWFRYTWEQDGRLCWYQDPEHPDYFFVSRLIKYMLTDQEDNGTSKLNLGVLMLKFNMAQMMGTIESSKMTPSTEFLILDSNHKVLYGKNSMINQAMTALFSSGDATEGYSLPSKTVTIDNHSYTVNAHQLDNGWILIAAIPNSEILKRLTVVKTIIINTTLIALACGIILSLFTSYKISNPIRRLALAMRQVHSQDNITQIYLPKKTNDEVGILYDSFNLMMNRIKHLLEEVYRMGIKEKDAEFKALQAQINPHFLYNTLDSVNWMAMKMGSKPITSVISSLSSLLRYAISDADELVTAAEEVEQVKRYVLIQSICYGKEFAVVYEIDPLLAECKMPRLILQPLVENAILHGAARSGGNDPICINLWAAGETLHLMVSNSGDSSLPDKLNEYLRGSSIFHSKPDGNGIRNVDQRLKLKFGTMYGLSYEPGADGSIKAIVTMPSESKHQK